MYMQNNRCAVGRGRAVGVSECACAHEGKRGQREWVGGRRERGSGRERKRRESRRLGLLVFGAKLRVSASIARARETDWTGEPLSVCLAERVPMAYVSVWRERAPILIMRCFVARQQQQ